MSAVILAWLHVQSAIISGTTDTACVRPRAAAAPLSLLHHLDDQACSCNAVMGYRKRLTCSSFFLFLAFSNARFLLSLWWTVQLVLYQVTKSLITTNVHRSTHWRSQPQTKGIHRSRGQYFTVHRSNLAPTSAPRKLPFFFPGKWRNLFTAHNPCTNQNACLSSLTFCIALYFIVKKLHVKKKILQQKIKQRHVQVEHLLQVKPSKWVK